MGIEIERRWLVKSPPTEYAPRTCIVQYYYGDNLRIRSEYNPLTGICVYTRTYKSDINHISREEIEDPINTVEFIALRCLAHKVIRKDRYRYPHGGLVIELDRIRQNDEYLWIAEVELESEDQQFDPPEWFGEEITGNKSYNNFTLAESI